MPTPRCEARQALRVRCKACDHTWVGLYLPMPMADAARVMGKLTCPMCAADAKQILVYEGKEDADKSAITKTTGEDPR